jgi:pantoate--beta-alanine ligase
MMKAETRSSVREVVDGWRQSGQRVALVPTMGNLHPGHISLVRAAHDHADRVIASIYVNPTQFGEGEDFEKYPRTLESDLSLLQAEKCDLAFVPGNEELYPFGIDRAVLLNASPDLAGRLEGRFRPGHFDGVVSVVARLFAIVMPDLAIFGEKDYQQLLVIRRMVEDLGFAISVIGEQTVRAESGLALSSRNAYLDETRLVAAETLNRVLADTAKAAGVAGANLEALEEDARAHLAKVGLKVEYVAVRRASDLKRPKPDDIDLRVLAAAWCGRTRLIDNMAV